MEFIEYARFENNCFWSYNSFSRRENCEPFCFSCNLSSFISKFQRLHIRALCIFFGQEDRRPPKSECARTPMISGAYIRVGIYLWRSTALQNSLSEVKKKKEQKRRKENMQAIKTLAMIVILFTICLLPGQIAWLLLDFGGQQGLKVAIVIFKFSDILDCLHACVNPIVQGLLSEIRKEYKRYFLHCFTCMRHEVARTK